MTTGQIERVSVASDGGEADNHSGGPGLQQRMSISGDGRYVAFMSDATDLVARDTNRVTDAFVHDRILRTTTRVSVSSTGAQLAGDPTIDIVSPIRHRAGVDPLESVPGQAHITLQPGQTHSAHVAPVDDAGFSLLWQSDSVAHGGRIAVALHRAQAQSWLVVTDYSDLLARITARALDEDETPLPPPVDEATLAEAERRLGFRLHPLLAAVYRRIGDGGFGPDYQLLSLVTDDEEETVVSGYLKRRTRDAGTEWAWPEGVLPVLTWGCAMYACVDCRTDEGTVLLFEPNPGDPDIAWYIDTPSLAEWFEHYVNDSGWWALAEFGEDFDSLPPWPHARDRAS